MSDRLLEYLLGSLGAAEAAELERELDASPALTAELEELRSAMELVALSAPPIVPSPGARERLATSLEGPSRYAPFLAGIAALADLTIARVRELFTEITDPAAWGPGPAPGVRLFHFTAGPRAQAHDAGFVRLEAGAQFPAHKHLGAERVLVIEGSYVELETGLVVRAGDEAPREAGSTHAFRALEPLLFAVVLGDAIEIDGLRLG